MNFGSHRPSSWAVKMGKLGTSSLPNFIRSFVRSYSAPVDSSIPASKIKYVPASGTYPKGFSASGTHVGVKPSNTSKPDIALIASDRPCNAAAVFTTNKFQAAPVQISRSVLEKRGGSGLRGIIVNSGCANAVTGAGGLEDAQEMASTTSSLFTPDDTSLRSQLPSHVHRSHWSTPTDTKDPRRHPIRPYSSLVNTSSLAIHRSRHNDNRHLPQTPLHNIYPPFLHHSGATYSLVGMTKGAGMIHPNMATLLGILCTDAPIAPSALQPLLTTAATHSFNSISIDGDTSTNDTLAILANGAAAPSASTPSITSTSSPDYAVMQAVLTSFSQKLAQLVVRDGEGATKFVQITVKSAPSYKDAHLIASTIARSPLVKTALYGKDANWGRILCSIGYTQSLSPNAIDPAKTNVSFVPTADSASRDEGVLRLLINGEPEKVDEERAARLLEDEDLEILVDLGTGEEEAVYWTCDFSHEYVTINGDYRT